MSPRTQEATNGSGLMPKEKKRFRKQIEEKQKKICTRTKGKKICRTTQLKHNLPRLLS